MESLIQEIILKSTLNANSIAIEGEGLSVSYAELLELSFDYAEFIHKEETSNEWVAIDVGLGWKSYAAILGCWITGNGYVPVNFDFPESRIKEIKSQVNWTLLIDSASGVSKKVSSHKVERSEGEKAYLLFTSGTTGAPKGVPISQINLKTFVSHYLNHDDIKFDSDDKFLQSYELTFDVSVFCFLMPFLTGGTLVLPSETNSKQLGLFKAIRDYKVTVTSFVPSVVRLTLQALPRVEFLSIRYSFFSGEALMGDWAKIWMNCVPKAQVYNCYGPTETVIVCTEELLNNLSEDYFESENPLPLGRSFKGVNLEMIEGEIVYSGSQVFKGYLNQESVSKYYSGDLAHLDENGKLIFDGRKDNQIQWNGYRIELEEIDNLTSRKVDNWVKTIYLKDSQSLVVFSGAEEAVVRQGIIEIFPKYYSPSFIMTITGLPLNVNGKVNTSELVALAKSKIEFNS